MQIIYSPQFKREYKRLTEGLRIKAKEKENVFRENPFDPKLKTHKLGGQWGDCWAFSIDYDCRIIFSFESEGFVIFHIIGDHSIYNR